MLPLPLWSQLDFLVHLLDVTGPYLDNIVRVLNLARAALPVDLTTYQGQTTIYTKDKGTVGMQQDSVVLAQKPHPTSELNNGAPIAQPAPAVPIGFSSATAAPAPEAAKAPGKHRRSLLDASA